MRKGALLALLFCAGAFGQDTLLEGVTVDSSTGRPLAGVHVRVFTIDRNNVAKTHGAISDSAGHFSIAKIPPGSYFCLGERTGYLSLRKGGGNIPFTPVIVKSGERVTGFKLEMTPRATIAGRVLDEYGDPVQNVHVQITPVSPDAPVAFSMTLGSSQTDDRGEYRLPAAPGKYRVRANVSQMGRTAEVRTDGTSAAEYVPTWYPDSATAERGSAVEVAAGAEVNGVDIRLSRRGAALAGVEGTVTGIPDSRGWANVHLVARDPESRSTFSQMTQTSGEGRFSFNNLRPGNYRLFARYTIDNKALVSQTVEFTDAAPPSGVVLRLAPAPDVTGMVVFDGGNAPEARRKVTLRPLEFGGMTPAPAGETDAANGFRISGVFPGRYQIAVQPLPENAYLRAVELDGAAAVPEDLELLRGASGLKIAIGRNAAQIAGNALDKDGAVLRNTLGAVVLIRDLSKIEMNNEESVARLTPEGSYSFKGLRPGKYWLLALDVFRSGNFAPEQLKKYSVLAEAVELKEGDRLRKDLTIVSQEALDAKAK